MWPGLTQTCLHREAQAYFNGKRELGHSFFLRETLQILSGQLGLCENQIALLNELTFGYLAKSKVFKCHLKRAAKDGRAML